MAIDEEQVRGFLTEAFEEDLHVKRIVSLVHATLGAVQATSLSVAAIGKALAWARGEDISPKHAVKQVDRLLSNGGVDGVAPVKSDSSGLGISSTDFEADDQETLVASLVTRHGRSTPLMWTTLVKSAAKGNRQLAEDLMLERLRAWIGPEVQVTILADRGFADIELYALLDKLGFHYIVRFRSDVRVTAEGGESKLAREWVPAGGRAKMLRGALVTAAKRPVNAVVCVQRKGMKEVRVSTPERRDKLLLISALAQALLTLLGAAGESLGYDKQLKANTAKKRTHSLFTQGAYYFMAMPRMSDARLLPLVERFNQLLREHAVFQQAFGYI